MCTRRQLVNTVFRCLCEERMGLPSVGERVLSVCPEKVFSDYQLNGETLPLKHGFPLRVVAEGYYGYDWIKYVQRITADKI